MSTGFRTMASTQTVRVLTAVLGMVAGVLALVSVSYDSGFAKPVLESFYYRWLASSEAGAERAYRELLSGNSDRAVELFRDLAERDRESPYRWCDYGEALLAAGKREEARNCMLRAAELGPFSRGIRSRQAPVLFSFSRIRPMSRCSRTRASPSKCVIAASFSCSRARWTMTSLPSQSWSCVRWAAPFVRLQVPKVLSGSRARTKLFSRPVLTSRS